MFKELCGKDNFKNVLLVTTMWDEVAEEAGSAREQELHADFWQAMIALGSTIHRFEGTTESAWKIIDSLSVPPLASHCPLHGAVLSQLISVLRASLVTVELVRIHCLKNAIAPSLSLALFMETTAGTHHAFFQVVEVATLLINVVMGHAKVVKLSADVKNAINAFAK
ncbi:hypothetical protein F5141DRAFT_1136077 [Pisolithus sp. B1]|nr:hypothetical protein F5141DRAFT_1136077 [Pisolithus sp. B1]